MSAYSFCNSVESFSDFLDLPSLKKILSSVVIICGSLRFGFEERTSILWKLKQFSAIIQFDLLQLNRTIGKNICVLNLPEP